jgi:uncharacterized protein (TIGR02117 family)
MKTIYVLAHGFHTGLALRRADISCGIWPESHDFKDFEYLELGWGDEGFYGAEKVTLAITFVALFVPTLSVLHVVGFNLPVLEYYTFSTVVEIAVSEAGFRNLCHFIHQTYYRDEHDRVCFLRPGIYGQSRFYRCHERYYLPKTCNVWTARALRAAGFPVPAARILTSDGVYYQARRFGKVLRRTRTYTLKRIALSGVQPTS